MSAPPGWDCGLETPGAVFRQPDGAAAQIRLDQGDLDEPGLLETAQVAGQGRLVEPGPLPQGADSIVAGGRDMGHEAELRDVLRPVACIRASRKRVIRRSAMRMFIPAQA